MTEQQQEEKKLDLTEGMFTYEYKMGETPPDISVHMSRNCMASLRKKGITAARNIGQTHWTDPDFSLETMKFTSRYLFVLHNDPHKEQRIAAVHKMSFPYMYS